MIKYLVSGLVLVGIIGAAYYYLPRGGQADTASEAQPSGSMQVIGGSTWTFTDAGEKDGIPQTNVAVDVQGAPVAVGTFEGHCADMAGSAWTMREGASAGAICWFAGGGTEIGVFRENDRHVIKTAVLDEGTAEEGGVRGEMVTLISL